MRYVDEARIRALVANMTLLEKVNAPFYDADILQMLISSTQTCVGVCL